MDADKDYYVVLGVLPTAEDVVIRAAFKALAQRYHPDRFCGSKEEANRHMAELSMAYSVLSDSFKRAEYDKSRGVKSQEGDSYLDPSDEPPKYDPLSNDWETLIDYYPDLTEIESRLSNISWRLAYSYRAYLLESKSFKERLQISEEMERQFLELYFGPDVKILSFAKDLIRSGNKSAAKALNKAIKILGNGVDSNRIIAKITADFNLTETNYRNSKFSESIVVKSCPSCKSLNSNSLFSCFNCGPPLPQ